MKVTRRRFLTTMVSSLAAPAAVSALPSGTGEASSQQGASTVRVSALPPTEAVPRLLSSVPLLEDLIRKGARVILKPNVSWPNPPSWATTTDPAVVAAAARYCVQRGVASVLVIDHPLGKAERCLERTGIDEAIRDIEGVRLLLLSRAREFVPRKLPEGSQLSTVDIAKELLRATCIINIPKAKAHSATSVSFGIKNLMGFVFNRQAFHSEANLHTAAAELLHVIKPHATLLDATTALTSRGPQGPGQVEDVGLLAVSTDIVAIDAYACTLARWDGRAQEASAIGHIREAGEMGFGSTEYRVHYVS
jgi:uncharacterized protein (DUF362 family)